MPEKTHEYEFLDDEPDPRQPVVNTDVASDGPDLAALVSLFVEIFGASKEWREPIEYPPLIPEIAL
jgi:hypothetical protein